MSGLVAIRTGVIRIIKYIVYIQVSEPYVTVLVMRTVTGLLPVARMQRIISTEGVLQLFLVRVVTLDLM
jgi:hypothetical protein